MSSFPARVTLLPLALACGVLASCQRHPVLVPASIPLVQAIPVPGAAVVCSVLPARAQELAPLPLARHRLPVRHGPLHGRAARAVMPAVRRAVPQHPRDFNPSVWEFFGVACVLLAGLAAGFLLVGLVLLADVAFGAALWCLAGAAASVVAALVAFIVHGS